MKIQLLVSAVDQNAAALIKQMNIQTDAVMVNQCDRYGYEEIENHNHKIQVYYISMIQAKRISPPWDKEHSCNSEIMPME